MSATIEVLYFAGCPHFEQAVELVREVALAERVSPHIRLRKIDTEEEAQQHKFYGSPTIRVNGEDVVPIPADSVPTLACRLYHDAKGQLSPLPPREAILAALRRRPETWAPASVSRRDALRVGAAGMMALLGLGHTTPALAAELAQLAGNRPMTAARLAGILQDERARWNALLAQVGPERMEAPGVEGTWSVKELVAHLTWYERAVVEGARQVASTGSFDRESLQARSGLAGLSMDERNAVIAERSRARPAADVLAEAETVFGQLLGIVAAMPDELLNDSRLLGLADDIPPWMRVANNSYSHYRVHEDALQAWLDGADR
jgi:hypothetical protein